MIQSLGYLYAALAIAFLAVTLAMVLSIRGASR